MSEEVPMSEALLFPTENYGKSQATIELDDEDVQEQTTQQIGPDPFLPAFLARKITGLDLKGERPLTTGCVHLDRELNGGIPSFGLTEIVGESGTGKTQICLQLALSAQLPTKINGLNSGVVYINTESAFPSKRLAELVDHFKNRFKGQVPPNLMDGIILEHIADGESLTKCLKQRLPEIIKKQKIGLIILDSIAAIFRSEYDSSTERARGLREVATMLHNIAARNHIIIVVVNQVTASLSGGGSVPSLGLTWRNFVTTRIHISRKEDNRSMIIRFSPQIKHKIIPFELGPEGIRGII